ncbi:hypothetical protein FISHEDRAFT_58577 [Fistulina hepatica ATCC 64428]|uniref:DUF6570 domain-containing protein n=1 Tax=Fistulina hepatica ATCC 64428 TaxID=1128425 RepID=A0A0D7AGH6_9AGAR|nr:hypothetical protein FISHEDRAFT_58577 [Fistulina hepatica ATCC 64428]
METLCVEDLINASHAFLFIPTSVQQHKADIIKYLQSHGPPELLDELRRRALDRAQQLQQVKDEKKHQANLRRAEKRKVEREDAKCLRTEWDTSKFLDLPNDDELCDIYRQMYEATSTADSLKLVYCAVCGCERDHLDPKNHYIRIPLNDLPNAHRLIPQRPHPAQQLMNGMLLAEAGIHREQDMTSIDICNDCHKALQHGNANDDEPPKYSWVNNLWIGEVLIQLQCLTIPESLLISLVYPRVIITKLFPKARIASMLEGNMMPRHPAILASILSITFIGKGKIPKNWIRQSFCLPAEDKVPQEIWRCIQHERDEGVLDEEDGGYVVEDDDITSNGDEDDERKLDETIITAKDVPSVEKIPGDFEFNEDDVSDKEGDISGSLDCNLQNVTVSELLQWGLKNMLHDEEDIEEKDYFIWHSGKLVPDFGRAPHTEGITRCCLSLNIFGGVFVKRTDDFKNIICSSLWCLAYFNVEKRLDQLNSKCEDLDIDKIKEYLKSDRFQEKIIKFICTHLRSYLPELQSRESTKDVAKETEVAFTCHPPHPDDKDFDDAIQSLELRPACNNQIHTCDICDNDFIDENGNWGSKQTYGYINGWVPSILTWTRSNNDGKLLTNGADTKNITFYVTSYIAKNQHDKSNITVIACKTFAFHEQMSAKEVGDDICNQHRKLLFRLSHALNSEQVLSGPMVVSYLMGWGDMYQSHQYMMIYWSKFIEELLKVFPGLRKKVQSRNLDKEENPLPNEEDSADGIEEMRKEDMMIVNRVDEHNGYRHDKEGRLDQESEEKMMDIDGLDRWDSQARLNSESENDRMDIDGMDRQDDQTRSDWESEEEQQVDRDGLDRLNGQTTLNWESGKERMDIVGMDRQDDQTQSDWKSEEEQNDGDGLDRQDSQVRLDWQSGKERMNRDGMDRQDDQTRLDWKSEEEQNDGDGLDRQDSQARLDWGSREKGVDEKNDYESEVMGSTSNKPTVDEDMEGRLYAKSQFTDYTLHGKEAETMNVIELFVDTYDSKVNTCTMSNNEDDSSEDDDLESDEHNNLANFIGAQFPSADDEDNKEFYYASMLLLLKHWWNISKDLKSQTQTWEEAYLEFTTTMTEGQKNIISGIQYFHKCQRSAADKKEETNWNDDEKRVHQQRCEQDLSIEEPAEEEESNANWLMEEVLLTVEKSMENSAEKLHGQNTVLAGQCCGILGDATINSFVGGHPHTNVSCVMGGDVIDIASWTAKLNSVLISEDNVSDSQTLSR